MRMAVMAFLVPALVLSAQQDEYAELQVSFADSAGKPLAIACLVKNRDKTAVKEADASGPHKRIYKSLKPGRYTLRVQIGEGDSLSAALTLKAGETRVLALKPGAGSLTARADDPEGKPVSFCRVGLTGVLNGVEGLDEAVRRTRTAFMDGTLHATGLLPGRYTLVFGDGEQSEFSAGQHVQKGVIDSAESQGGVRVRYAVTRIDRAFADIRVADKPVDIPGPVVLAPCDVSLVLEADQNASVTCWQARIPAADVDALLREGGDNTYTPALRVDRALQAGREALLPLPPAPTDIVIRTDKGQEFVGHVDLRKGKGRLKLALGGATGTIAGRIANLDPKAQRAGAARIRWWVTLEGGPLGMAPEWSRDAARVGLPVLNVHPVDEEGRFEIAGLLPGAYTVHSWASVEGGAGTTHAEDARVLTDRLRLQQIRKVSAVVKESGKADVALELTQVPAKDH